MNHWGIRNWEPVWYESIIDFMPKLKRINAHGKRVISTYTLWDGDEWFEDAPVIINIGGINVELCANQIGQFSLTLDSIDIQSSVNWCEESDYDGPLIWKKNFHPLLKGLVNSEIQELGAIEYFLDENIQDLFNQDWVLSGVYLDTDSSHIEIYNALDCNGITDVKNSVPELRYIAK